MPKLTKYVGLFDLHIGWEYRHRRGERIVEPTHSDMAIAAALDFVADFQPDVVVLGGDQVNCAPVSHWNERTPGRVGNFTLKDELDALDDVVLSKLRSKKRVRRIWHRGNHERWFEDVLDRNPGLRGLTSLEGYLQLEARGYEIYDYGEHSQVGKLRFVHGDNIPGSTNIAASAARRYGGSNLRFGHFHTYQSYTLFNQLDETDTKTFIAVPCLAQVSQQYANNAPGRCLNGWVYGWVDEATGNFHDYVVVMADGKTVVEGKVYGGPNYGS